MVTKLGGAGGAGLERSCGATRSGWLRSRELSDGVQLLQAWFPGHGFDKHRHDTYATGLTDVGVQAFDYRGVTEVSTPGKVVVLHPDETHDGRAGTGRLRLSHRVRPPRAHSRGCPRDPRASLRIALRARTGDGEPDAGRDHRGGVPARPGTAGRRRPDPPPRRGAPRRR